MKKSISVILAAFLVIGFIPLMGQDVKAEGFYYLTVGDTKVGPDALEGEGWSYDVELNTLTLNGFKYKGKGYEGSDIGIEYEGSDALKINLIGENSIFMEQSDKVDPDSYAIASEESLIFMGDGDLIITLPDSTEDNNIRDSVAIFSSSDITVEGGEIIAVSGYAENKSVGIEADGSIYIKGGFVESEGYGASRSYGVFAQYDLIVTGGELRGVAVDKAGSKKTTVGIVALFGKLEVTGGKVYGQGADLQEAVDANSYGVYGGESVNVSGGYLCGIGGKLAGERQQSVGIFEFDKNFIVGTDASVVARGYSQAVFSKTAFTNGRSGLGWSDYDGKENETEIPVDSNYETVKGFKYVRFADPEIELDAEGFNGIYDGKEHTIKLSVKTPEEGYTIKYGLQRGKYDLDKAPSFKNAGYNKIYYIVQAEGYCDNEGDVAITIKKAPQTITADSLNLKVGQSAKINAKNSGEGKLSYVIKAGKAITLDKKTGKVTAVKEGTAYVLVTAAATDNYKTGVKVVKINVTAADPPVVKTVDMLRLYNPNSGEHFYTASTVEKDNLVKAGWKYEGLAWKAPVKSKTPVYRLYNKNAGDHHYTVSSKEKDDLIKAGWQYEGIGWYSDDAKTVPLYRLYNPNAVAGSHHYTTSKAESANLIKAGWKDEGIAWFGR